ncbi:MAG: hypothetical protein II896_02565 [Clostridia bacterium]|nr:hypothetical protein [Clostridia bacterium]
MKRTISIISIVTILVIVACSVSLCFVGCESTKQMNESVAPGDMLTITQLTELEAVSLEVTAPIYLSGGDSGSGYTQQSVIAVITPDSVQDKYVTWSVAWASGAALSSKNVSDYIQIVQDGSTTCTLKCFKAFRGSNIILTCTTRQNNKTCTATITYNGVPSDMTLGSASGAATYNLGSMSVPSLYVGQTYSVPINMTNIFNDVGSDYNNFTITVTGVGTVTLGNYTKSGRGAGWSTHDNTVELSSIANQMVSCTTTGATLKITVNKSIYGYFESSNTSHPEGLGETTTWTNKVYSVNTDADGNKPYVIITVKQTNYNFSATFKCFLEEQVASVAISGSNTITF